jgi:succinate dehydrogenase/fumarate reductase flavoprotein subunit
MLDLVIIEGKALGIIARNMDTGAVERHGAHVVVLATGLSPRFRIRKHLGGDSLSCWRCFC